MNIQARVWKSAARVACGPGGEERRRAFLCSIMRKRKVGRMNEARIDLLREWRQEAWETRVRFSFPAPEDAKGFYPYGFVRKNDSAADLVGWHGIFVTLREKREGAGQASDWDRAALGASDWDRAVHDASGVATLRARVSFAEQEPLETELAVILQGGGIQAEIPFTAFPLELAKGNRWEFVTAVEIA